MQPFSTSMNLAAYQYEHPFIKSHFKHHIYLFATCFVLTLHPSPKTKNPTSINIKKHLPTCNCSEVSCNCSTSAHCDNWSSINVGNEAKRWDLGGTKLSPLQGPTPNSRVVALKWGKPNDPNQSERYMYENSPPKKKESVYIEQICCLWEVLWRMEDLMTWKVIVACGRYSWRICREV